MKKFLIQATLLILVIGTALILYSTGESNKGLYLPFLPQRAKFANLQINDTNLKVELADTPAKRSQGLGGRNSLAENEGMLFIFQRADKYPFWMKGLSFPLDFVWISDLQVVDVLQNIKPPSSGEPDSSLPIYSSKFPIDKVLEVTAGTVDRLHIKVGDIIKLIPL